jgi:carbon monoxide dehydrogenase subunit G
MQLSETQSLPVPLAEAWAALNDLSLLQEAIPGCESLVQTGDDHFDATMAMPVGPLTTRFTARLRRCDVDAPHGCTLHFDANSPGGRSAGSAGMRLREDGGATTALSYDVTVEVEGVFAQMGSTLVDMAAQRMARQFFERFRSGLIARQVSAADLA